jgi:hypothetical protein
MNRPPVFTLPPLHLKVPHVYWIAFHDSVHRYVGKVYIDGTTIHYAGIIGKCLDRTQRVFKRRKRRARPLTVFLPRELLTWLAPVVERVSHDIVVDTLRPPGELPPMFRTYSYIERKGFSDFMHTTMVQFTIEARKTIIELVGGIE